MDIFFNGHKLRVKENLTIKELIFFLDLNLDLIVIECNKKILPKKLWQNYFLTEKTHIEILTIVGGG
uniref:Thiamine biosynthesis protein n=1 Tax=Olisthodiscus luteus TaxID=83000 RepID=A0A7U0QFY4_OLILU|nr:Thiamine biosynthesis protein [Olisthodiscus luteus]YP_010152850.1 Thiamine biosynthesis protein [Olisthodiscus luteus]QQW50441.1 Thiamine biosynthesis protein [Olisthodiscus luteus]QQW50511.1 Thiamine biosynthesis protein [Olisthodiscus luteus]